VGLAATAIHFCGAGIAAPTIGFCSASVTAAAILSLGGLLATLALSTTLAAAFSESGRSDRQRGRAGG
jgi:hypothetical protein